MLFCFLKITLSYELLEDEIFLRENSALGRDIHRGHNLKKKSSKEVEVNEKRAGLGCPEFCSGRLLWKSQGKI